MRLRAHEFFLPVNILNQEASERIKSVYRKEKMPLLISLEFLDKNFSRVQLDKFILNLLRKKVHFKIAPPPLCFFNFQYSKILKDNLKFNGLPVYFKETLISNRSSLAGIKNIEPLFECRKCNLYKKKCGGIFEKQFNKEGNLKRSKFFDKLWNFLSSSCQKNILDIGCGFPCSIEKYIELATNQKHNFFCVDSDESKIHSLGTFIQKRKLTRFIKVQAGVCEDLKFPSQYFDVVLMLNVYAHLFRLRQSLKEIRRVLKPGGLFFLWDGFHGPQRGGLLTGHINNHSLFLARKRIKTSNFNIVYCNSYKSQNEEYVSIIGKREKSEGHKLSDSQK